MKKRITLLLLVVLLSFSAGAQYTFSGRITYERRTNLHKLWDGNEWLEKFKDKVPKILVNYFDMNFSTASSHYKPGKEVEAPKINWGLPPGSENEVFMDFKTSRVTAVKQIFEQRFIIDDTVRRLKWRVTGEIRTIADYKCRKAVTKISDSVYVVAFYTDEIPVSGGPEQFGGLPGMILELAVPRLHTTWVATQVLVASGMEDKTPASPKGKRITHAELVATLQRSLKDWGKEANRNIWWSLL